MNQLVDRLEHLETKLAHFSKDLKVLQQLHSIQDPQAQLNKIRYISEGILQLLCKRYDVGWGKSEPTLERMIGPLRAKKILPAPIASHLRSIQSTTSPGSHYQMDKLSDSHVQIAMLALIELLDWYLSEIDEGESNPDVHLTQEDISPFKRNVLTKWYMLAMLLAIGIVYTVAFRTPSNHPSHKLDKVEKIQSQYMYTFSNRHFLTIQLLNQLTNSLGRDEQLIEQSLKNYRVAIVEYNIDRGVYRLELQRLFGDEVYLFEREIHNELFYANKNIECMIHNMGDNEFLVTGAQHHLQTARSMHEELNHLLDGIVDGSIKWPIPLTRRKEPLDSKLENPC